MKKPTRVFELLSQSQREIARLRAALLSIANHPHCSYPWLEDDRSYRTGVADGHRCAAEIARAELERITEAAKSMSL